MEYYSITYLKKKYIPKTFTVSVKYNCLYIGIPANGCKTSYFPTIRNLDSFQFSIIHNTSMDTAVDKILDNLF